ncbi:unnamed protein product [Withania somnifera]
MKNALGSSTKLILLHPYIQKQGSSNRFWALAFVSFLTLAFLLTLIYTRESKFATSVVVASTITSTSTSPLSKAVARALVHYASNSNNAEHMSYTDIKHIADVIQKCSQPCNFLVFGLTHETLLWKALNHNAYIEEKCPEIEAYDVQYTTKLSEMKELIAGVKEQVRNECKPVQNLLFSECKLGLNDLPNQFYEVDWDVILVDGPRGYWPEAPGRMSAIFTASTHIFVHDFSQQVDRVTSDEFLCKENLVKSMDMLGHFVLERMDANSFQFCRNHNSTTTN